MTPEEFVKYCKDRAMEIHPNVDKMYISLISDLNDNRDQPSWAVSDLMKWLADVIHEIDSSKA